jgi:hypothetical protein
VVEQSPVKRLVVGSIPTAGAKTNPERGFCFARRTKQSIVCRDRTVCRSTSTAVLVDKLRHDSRKVVDCRTCSGTGKFKHPYHQMTCTECSGDRSKAQKVKTGSCYFKCGSCNGTGEIEIWNPVLAKGRLVFR